MTRHFAILLTATAIAACSSDPQAMTEPANVASITPGALAGAPSQAEFLASEPATPDAYVPARQAEPSLLVPPPMVVPERSAPKAASPVRSARANSCHILVKRTSSGVELKAVADLWRSAEGDYSFVIAKSGGSGSSDINQGGPFEGRAGERIDLGASEISMGRGASYRATLILSSHGRELCRRTVRS
jgi:hypothetical protein